MNEQDSQETAATPAPVLRNASDLAVWTEALCDARGISPADTVSKIQKWAAGEATLNDFPTTDTLKAMADEAGIPAPIVDLWDLLPATPFDDDESLAGEVRAWAHRLATAHQLTSSTRHGRALTPERCAEFAELIVSSLVFEGPEPPTEDVIAELQASKSQFPRVQIQGILSRRGIIKPRRAQWDRVRERLISASQKTAGEVDAIASDVLGSGMGPYAAIRWATTYLGEEDQFRWEDVPGIGDVLFHERSGGWFRLAYRAARNAVRFRGAAWMPLVYADALRESGDTVGWDRFVAAVQKLKGYREIGERGWFTIDGAEQNMCFDMVDNIIAAAGRACTFETLHEGIFRTQLTVRTTQHQRVSSSALGVMPLDEFRDLIEMTERYRVIFRGSVDIERMEDRHAALTRLKKSQALLDYARERSGIVTMTEATLSTGSHKYTTLQGSPMFREVEDGIYAIRGVRIDPARLEKAQEERDENARSTTVEVTMDGTITFIATFAAGDKKRTGLKALRAGVPLKAQSILCTGVFRNVELGAELTVGHSGLSITGDSARAFGLYGPQRARVFINVEREEAHVVPVGGDDEE